MSSPASAYVKSILVIDDSKDYGDLLIAHFKSILPTAKIKTYDIADDCPSAEYGWTEYQLVIVDYDLDDGESGLEWIRPCKSLHDFPASIMLTGSSDQNVVVNAFRYGAQDFLNKTN